MNFPFYIAKRYLFSKSKQNAINIITIIAGIGAFVGAMALFIVLSGFSGLKVYSLQFTNEIDPDLKVMPAKGKTILLDSTKSAKLRENQLFEGYTKVVEERVLLSYQKRSTPAVIKGVDFNFNGVTQTQKHLFAGSWFQQNTHHVIIGSGIAKNLSMGIGGYGDNLKIQVPKPGKGQITNPRKAFNAVNSTVTGIYSISEDLNSKYVFTPISMAKSLLGLKKNEVSSIGLKLAPNTTEKEAISALHAIFGNQILVKNRIQLNDELYKMLNTENLAAYLIFTLVLIIALFNVGGAIVMAILDKRENIQTLYNLGALPGKIRAIFFLQGTLLTLIGGIAGLLIGIITVLLQQHYGWVKISGTLPYPVELNFQNTIAVFCTIMILGVVASYIGSARTAKVLSLSSET